MGDGEKTKKKGKKKGSVRLFEPMTLRGVTMRNRIWLPPWTRIRHSHRMASLRHSTTSIMYRVPWAVSA